MSDVLTNQGTTQLVSNDDVIAVVPSAGCTLPDNYYDSASAGTHTTLEEYFQRPYPITSGVFSSTDDATTFSNLDYMGLLLKTDHYSAKFDGKFVVRATVQARLMVNANKFQAGRYILAFLPTGGLCNTTAYLSKWIAMHRHSKVQITQLPHVEIDLATQTEAILEIPYVSSYNGVTQQSVGNNAVYGTPGVFFIYPYVPLTAASGSLTAGYCVMVSLKDVKLEGVAVPQSNIPHKRGRDPVREEQKKAGIGPVTSALRCAAKSFGVLSKVPILTSFAAPAAWASDIAANVASVWGWSKPGNLAPTLRSQKFSMLGGPNGDGADNSLPLSLVSSNAVRVAPGFGGSDYDEMAIDYIKSIYAYLKDFTWGNEMVRGATLTTIPINLLSMANWWTEGGIELVDASPLSLLARNFMYYRGGLTFRLKFVKTPFHSGRITIVYQPQDKRSGIVTAATLDTSVFGLKAVVDIRTTTEVEFSIPFMSNTPWAPCNCGTNVIGTILIFVDEQLVAPESVTADIKVLVEVKGADDLEFAVPTRQFVCHPVVPYIPQMDMGQAVDLGYLGGSKELPGGTQPSELCIGEKVLSIRQLIKRYCYYGSITATNTGNLSTIRMDPFAFNIGVNVDATHYNAPAYYDDLDVWQGCFLFNRGSMRVRAFTGDKTCRMLAALYQNFGAVSTAVSDCNSANLRTYSKYNYYSYIQEFVSALTGALEVTVPQYHHTHSRNTATQMINSISNITPSPYFLERSIQQLYISSSDSTSAVYTLYRATGEDFSLGCFVSVPTFIEGFAPST